MGFSLGGIIKGAASGFVASGGNPWGAVAGGAMGAYGEHQENSAKKEAQNWWKYQFDQTNNATERQMKNRIQWSVEDALKAGINPAVAAGAPSNVTGGASPNTSMYEGINARANTMNAMANESNAQTANHAMRSQTMLNESNAYKNYTEAGLMDRNTAAKEVQAHAAEMQAYARAQEVDAVINRMNALLPGELQGQALELGIKAFNNQLTAREKEVLDKTGLTLSEWKGLGKEALSTVRMVTGGWLAGGRNIGHSAKEFYNSRGQFTGAVKYVN